MKRFINLFTFLLSLSANAQFDNLQDLVYSNANRSVFVILKSENDVFFIDKYSVKPGSRFQNLFSSKKYSSYKLAVQDLETSVKSQNLKVLPPDENLESSSNFITEAPDKVLWTHKNNWSFEWEKIYTDWVTKNITTDFMVRYNIPSDCADLAYISRWIFAREHSLPAANRLTATGSILSNLSMRQEWLKLPTSSEWYKDKRFLAALDYLTENTYTHTIGKDSYPITISSESVTPGTHHLAIYKNSGHTLLVAKVNEAGQAPLIMYYSNVPKVVRPLYETVFTNRDLPKKNEGFLKFLWPVIKSNSVSFIAAEKMPFYSLEQYDSAFLKEDKEFSIAVMKRLQPDFSWKNLIDSIFKDLTNRITDRIEVVKQGYDFCKKNDCSPGSAGYEDWSTPSRDQRIITAYKLLSNYSFNYADNDTINSLFEKLESTEFEIQGEVLNIKKILFSFLFSSYSFDPNADINERWGLSAQAYAKNVISKIRKIETEKAEFVKNRSKCNKNDCEQFSEKWMKASTYEFDNQYKYILRGLYYTQQTNFKLYAELMTYLIGEKIEGQPIADLIKNIPQINSDPHSSQLVNSNWKLLSAEALDKFIITRDSSLYLRKKNNLSEVINLNTGETLSTTLQNPDLYIVDLNVEKNLWLELLDTDDKTIVSTYKNQKELVHQFEIPILSASYIKMVENSTVGPYILFNQTKELALNAYSLDGKKLFSYTQSLPVKQLRNHVADYTFFVDDSQQICLFKHTAPDQLACTASGIKNNSLASPRILENDLLVFITYLSEKSSRYVLYSKVTKSFIHEFSSDKLTTLFLGRVFTIKDQNQVSVFEAQPDGTITKVTQLAPGIELNQVTHNIFRLIQNLMPQEDFYSIQNLQLKKVVFAPRADESSTGRPFYFQNQYFLLVKKVDGTYRLRNSDFSFSIDFKQIERGALFSRNNKMYMVTNYQPSIGSPTYITRWYAIDLTNKKSEMFHYEITQGQEIMFNSGSNNYLRPNINLSYPANGVMAYDMIAEGNDYMLLDLDFVKPLYYFYKSN